MPRFLARGVALVTMFVLASTTAQARGYYFNKPGVSRDSYMADVAECIELAGGARASNVQVPYSPNIIAVGAGAFFAGMQRSADRRRISRMVERTCMADKGYSRYEVDNSVLHDIHELPTEAARLDRLFGLAASAEPIGERMRE